MGRGLRSIYHEQFRICQLAYNARLIATEQILDTAPCMKRSGIRAGLHWSGNKSGGRQHTYYFGVVQIDSTRLEMNLDILGILGIRDIVVGVQRSVDDPIRRRKV